jgi:hypothetical protein
MTLSRIAVLLPVLNARHLLWRSLASLMGQSRAPAQVLVLDEGSTDGLADWLRLRWPGVELHPVAGEPAQALDTALAGVTAEVVAFLEPGDHWPRDHLGHLAERWAAMDRAALALPATTLARRPDGRLAATAPRGERPLAALSAATPHLRAARAGTASGNLRAELRGRLAALAPAATDGVPVVAIDAAGPDVAVADPAAWAGMLEPAAAGLPAGAGAVLVDLRAAASPAGLLNLLGLAVAIGGSGRAIQAMTLADLTWAALEAAPAGAAVVVTAPTPLELRHAGDQLCIEEVVRRCPKRPVRLAVRSLLPSTPTLVSRLIEAASAHPDLELWVNDAPGHRYAASLLGRGRVRLVPPPLLGLLGCLRPLGERGLLEPALLGGGNTPAPGLAARFLDLERWAEGLEGEVARRLAPALARLLGLAGVLRGDLLQQAWAMTLLGWSAARREPGPFRSGDLDTALFAAMCGRPALFEPGEPKTRDVARTWAGVLPALGVEVAEPAAGGAAA